MISIFNGLNVALGILALALALIGAYHLDRRLRFSPQQERTALRFFAAIMGFLGVNFISSGLLTSPRNIERIGISLFAAAMIPLAAKALALLTMAGLICWVLFWFWPSQTKR